ncbi:Uncharacterised protein (plasmid) [Legionella adelaidensis]|uniref:Uncharacterized protein n=2 Tax=Legionella adelaidensis TaxID=45056 RepID=A0A0W0R125_9GAMM|nr:hypothetical protein Lade_1943 [Legionella adelaidensis]VEH86117.1 Uncharacterised protein [Legionella adelaidensis]
MFKYNRFWHFWYRLDNRHYSRTYFFSFISTLLLSAIFIPVSWPAFFAIAAVTGIAVATTFKFFNALSDFFFAKQNNKLLNLKENSENPELKEQIDFYLNRRCICPAPILEGNVLSLEGKNANRKIFAPLLRSGVGKLNIQPASNSLNRNLSYTASEEGTGEDKLFMKKVSASDGLNEIAAREMAEIIGLEHIIPLNEVTKGKADGNPLLSSKKKMEQLVAERREPNESVNPENIARNVARFLSNLKHATYQTQAKEGRLEELLYLQKQTQGLDGLKWYLLSQGDYQKKAVAMNILGKINIPSFQQSILLQLILGCEDANLGNVLFYDVGAEVHLHSIDHERIMPGDNYNVSKSTLVTNGPTKEILLDNVFPFRLALAGFPQANIPFSKEVLQNCLDNLDPVKLLAYHRKKKLFSPAAVGAQLERVELIRNLFKEALAKPEITLTPKELVLKFVNNHPSYAFLKSQKLSDFAIFLQLGQITADADLSLLRHPLQWAPVIGELIKISRAQLEGRAPEMQSNNTLKASFFANVTGVARLEKANPSMHEFRI